MTNKELAKITGPIIFGNEGSYTTVVSNDNGALSIGKVQWHGTRALNLLKTIVNKLSKDASKYLSTKLLNEIKTSKKWDTRITSNSEKLEIQKILKTSVSKQAQDDLAISDISSYINKGISTGLKDDGALIYFADFANQYGTGSKLLQQITKEAIKKDGGTIESMYERTKANTSKYLTRRKKVYDAVTKLNLNTVVSATNKQTSKEYSQKDFIKDVQKAIGVTVDGSAGPITMSKTPTISRKKNNEHKVVAVVQKWLKLKGYYTDTVDGHFGPNTEKAVIKYQKEVVKLSKPDGEITSGNATWKKLLGRK